MSYLRWLQYSGKARGENHVTGSRGGLASYKGWILDQRWAVSASTGSYG